MKVAVFNAKPYDRRFLNAANTGGRHELVFLPVSLNGQTSILADGCGAVCVFVNDVLNEAILSRLHAQGTRLIALRCSGFNNVDIQAAERLGLTVVRVPAYSPEAVAEHALALIFCLNRKIHRAYARVREGNFDLEGLLGATLAGKTAGVVGTGRIGARMARLLKALGLRVLASDPSPQENLAPEGVAYMPLKALLAEADIVTLHCPLTPETRHLIGDEAVAAMKPKAMLINTSRGAVIDTAAVIRGLKSGRIGSLGLDVYEEEGDLFFQNLSDTIIQDDVFSRLLTFPNVLITGHQAFFTEEAMKTIAETTLENISAFEDGQKTDNEVTLQQWRPA